MQSDAKCKPVSRFCLNTCLPGKISAVVGLIGFVMPSSGFAQTLRQASGFNRLFSASSDQIVAAVIGALLLGIFTAAAALAGWRIRRFQTAESDARTELSLNIEVFVRVIPITESRVEAGAILETRIDVANNSRRVCCIPAVYVMARSLVKSGLEHSYLGESDFESLASCGKLSEIRNVARVQNTIVQVAPDESERFVRWDTLDQNLVDTFPVVVINVEVFGASAEFLGERHTKKGVTVGQQRLDWLQFMDQENGARHHYIVFDRWHDSKNQHIRSLRPNQRILNLPDGGVDIRQSERFRQVLDSVVQWSRHTTVVVRGALQKESHNLSP